MPCVQTKQNKKLRGETDLLNDENNIMVKQSVGFETIAECAPWIWLSNSIYSDTSAEIIHLFL